VNEKNFLGQGINLNFTGTFSTQSLSGEFSYLNPNFRDSEKELGFSLISQKDDYSNSGYINKTIGSRLATKYEVFEDIYFRPNINIQSDKLETNSNATALLQSRQGTNITTGVGYNFSIDLRDSRYNPTTGSLTYFEQNYATLISDIPAIQTSFGSTMYKELFSDKYIGSAKIRLSNSTALNNKDIKLSDRLYASQNDLRGFELKGVGPIDGSAYIGGNYLATLGLKSTFPNPIPENLRPNSYLFFDAGNVWGVDYSDLISSNSKIRSSTGVALDIMSPVGPLSFTYAIPLSKASTDKEQRFLFNIGSSF
jgi:outer membrane protein insertion porin family